ncbi:hypothetical protein B4135_1881 [Caldibacillus debilis]|uniref:Uncharacterized protein n=1 Tax=Caldibacillus debilis TaxID=301148 RepID=A0A150M7I3_9BACI|nr:hypothetical protein B4135_1881 [Caldibacillus debilis]
MRGSEAAGKGNLQRVPAIGLPGPLRTDPRIFAEGFAG